MSYCGRTYSNRRGNDIIKLDILYNTGKEKSGKERKTNKGLDHIAET